MGQALKHDTLVDTGGPNVVVYCLSPHPSPPWMVSPLTLPHLECCKNNSKPSGHLLPWWDVSHLRCEVKLLICNRKYSDAVKPLSHQGWLSTGIMFYFHSLKYIIIPWLCHDRKTFKVLIPSGFLFPKWAVLWFSVRQSGYPGCPHSTSLWFKGDQGTRQHSARSLPSLRSELVKKIVKARTDADKAPLNQIYLWDILARGLAVLQASTCT